MSSIHQTKKNGKVCESKKSFAVAEVQKITANLRICGCGPPIAILRSLRCPALAASMQQVFSALCDVSDKKRQRRYKRLKLAASFSASPKTLKSVSHPLANYR